MTTPLWQAALWGLLQGLTEFLPVSSSGHLALLPWIVNLPMPDLTFDLVAHLGTLVAVIVFLWRDIVALLAAAWRILRTRRIADASDHLVVWIIVGGLPAAAVGALAHRWVEQMLQAPWAIALCLAATGGLLYAAERLARPRRTLATLHLGDALVIGLAQALALMPGLSRSGATMAAGLARGLTREAAARYSFLLGAPIIAGAAFIKLGDALVSGIARDALLGLAVGLVVAGISGYLALRFLFRHLQRRDLKPFAWYCWGLAALGLILSVVR